MGNEPGKRARPARCIILYLHIDTNIVSFVIIPISFVHYEGCDHCDRVIYTGEPVRRGMAYEGHGVYRIPA